MKEKKTRKTNLMLIQMHYMHNGISK